MIAYALTVGAYAAQAQYNMSLRFDTATAIPGDTVVLDVFYKFTSSTPPKSVQDFNVRFEYDTTEVYAFDYILDGTASANMTILDTSHHGILAANGSLDFTNPILCKIRFRVNKRLADTALIQWDTDVSVFEYSDSINVTEQDGWIRTPSTAGNVTLWTPSMTVDTGEVFNAPVSISGIENANIDSAVLRFEVDSTDRLLFRGAVAATSSNSLVIDTSVSGDTVTIVLKALAGHIVSSDSMVTLSFYSVPWYDTACVTLRDLKFEALDSASLIGNTASSSGSICIVPGSKPPAGVNQSATPVAAWSLTRTPREIRLCSTQVP